ncbi:hypothetical protein FB446DRAFT_63139 [Lentinula raphanica]|nr:hypothetical protein FB446DRAFT_63139 [Lentinula raphanica]
MDLDVIKGLFGQGLMVIEISATLGAGNIFHACYQQSRSLQKSTYMTHRSTPSVNTIVRKGVIEVQKGRCEVATEGSGSFCLLQTEVQEIGDSTHCALDGTEMWIPDLTKPTYFWSSINIVRSKGYRSITYFVATKDVDIEIAQKEQKP